MQIRSPVHEGQVLCGARGGWQDIEGCFHCDSFVKVKRTADSEQIVCRTTLDRGLWSPAQRPSGLRV